MSTGFSTVLTGEGGFASTFGGGGGGGGDGGVGVAFLVIPFSSAGVVLGGGGGFAGWGLRPFRTF